MLELILEFFTSGGFGAIVGLLGGYLTKREVRKLKELEFKHEQFLVDKDIERDNLYYSHAERVADKQMEYAQIEGQIADDIKSADAFIESIKSQKTHREEHWVLSTIKTLMRPILTCALLWISFSIYVRLEALVGGLESLDPKLMQELFIYVIHAIIFLTITAVAWWFASRGERAVESIRKMFNR